MMGGSVGGLTAGLVLRDVGCDVQVFERSSAALEARGAGIAVLNDTVRYLVEHNVLDVDTVCSRTGWVRYLHRDGSTRYEEQRRYRFSSWNTIYRALLSCFPRDRYHLGREIDRFDQEGDTVTVRFADGSSYTCDLLVCADGIGSMGRHLLLPHAVPKYSGYVAWRGTVPESQLSPETFSALRDAITYQVLKNSHILVYPIPNRDGAVEPGHRLINFVWYRNVAEGHQLDDLMTDRAGERRSVSLPPGAVQWRFIAEMRSFAEAELAPPIAEVVMKTDEPFVQGIFDVEVPAMAFGRVCLIGDAAFAVRPHAAAGTAKAARDAWALAEALEATRGNVEAALERWEPGQLALGRQLMARTREIGNISQFEGTWVPGDPKLVFGLYGPGC